MVESLRRWEKIKRMTARLLEVPRVWVWRHCLRPAVKASVTSVVYSLTRYYTALDAFTTIQFSIQPIGTVDTGNGGNTNVD